jgi:hypothetical protein
MIHSQLVGLKPDAAMVADAARALALPPLALAQFARLLALTAHFGFGYLDKKGRRFHRQLFNDTNV